MKTLLLLRHAKSDWGDTRLDDHDRPLAPRGVRACARMGRWLASEGPTPELVLCSSARRARDTWEEIAPQLTHVPEMRVERGLYLASPDSLLQLAAGVEDTVGCLMLIGHNPGMHLLAAGLAGRGKPDALERLSRKFPTAALAALRFSGRTWRELGADEAELLHFVTPKSLER